MIFFGADCKWDFTKLREKSEKIRVGNTVLSEEFHDLLRKQVYKILRSLIKKLEINFDIALSLQAVSQKTDLKAPMTIIKEVRDHFRFQPVVTAWTYFSKTGLKPIMIYPLSWCSIIVKYRIKQIHRVIPLLIRNIVIFDNR